MPLVSIKDEATYQEPALLERAFALPVASRYRGVMEFQRTVSGCGPTSAANALRSMGRTTDQSSVLEGSSARTWFGLLPRGLTLDQLAEVVAVRLGRPPTVLRDLPLTDFRAEMVRSNDLSVRYIANFSRAPLFGWGGGHHSPIGGYLADVDLVLVLDVNRRFQPWLAPAPRIQQAITTRDGATGQSRGLLRIDC